MLSNSPGIRLAQREQLVGEIAEVILDHLNHLLGEVSAGRKLPHLRELPPLQIQGLFREAVAKVGGHPLFLQLPSSS